MFVEITLCQKNLYQIKGIAQEERNVSGCITIPIEQIKNLTDENRELMAQHISLALPCIEKVDEVTYKFIYTFENAKAIKLKALQEKTYQQIARHMPDWKLNRLQSYYNLSKKVLANGVNSLDALEKAEYDVFPNADETHEQCQQYASSVLQWIWNCIKTHGEVEQQIIKATDAVGLDKVSVEKAEYPKLKINEKVR